MENMATDVMCGDFFDHIDDLLDLANDNDRDFKPNAMAMAMGGMMPMETATAPPPYIHSDCGGLLPPPPTFPSPPMDAAAFDQKGDQLFDDLDIADLEWVSNFMDDSANLFFDFTAAPEHNKPLEEESLFRTPSPVSVLDSNSLSGGFASSTTTTTTTSSSSSSSSSTSNFCYPAGNGRRSLPHFSSVVPARARSKRPRPAAARAHVTAPFLPTTTPAEPESFGEAVMKKAKKKKNPLLPVSVSVSVSGEGEGEAGPQPQVRKCMHCEIQKTPQWRAGPMGPKTLCNACGVRYKSGRLFPEYRPAASPTFVPSLHSNSHKKVVEMRINATAPNSCDLLDYIRRRE